MGSLVNSKGIKLEMLEEKNEWGPFQPEYHSEPSLMYGICLDPSSGSQGRATQQMTEYIYIKYDWFKK